MGLFDRFNKSSGAGRPQGTGSQQAPRFTLADVVKAYQLQEKESYEPSLAGLWWEGVAGVTRFAVVEYGERLFVHIGTIAEITDIYLGRATADRPLPAEGSPGRIDRIVNNHPAARQFSLLAWPNGAFDLPRLRTPGVLDCLTRTSPAVAEVMIYDTYQGVTLVLRGTQSRADFDRDLEQGVGMVQALGEDEGSGT